MKSRDDCRWPSRKLAHRFDQQSLVPAKVAAQSPSRSASPLGRHEIENGIDLRATEESELPLLSKAKERALMRKIDLRLLPILCLIYLMAFLDR